MQLHALGLTLDGWAGLNIIVQFVLPLFVGLVTSKLTGRGSQAILLAVLTLLATVAGQVLTAHDTGQPLDLAQIVTVAIVNFIVSTGAHYGLWKPTGLTDLLLSLFAKTPAPAAPSAPTPDAPAGFLPPVVVNVATPADPAAVAAAVASGARHLAVPDPAPAVDPASAPVSRMAG